MYIQKPQFKPIEKTETIYQQPGSKYSYSAENGSIADCLILNPLAKKIVERIPFWVPANIITFISNLNIVVATVIALSYHQARFPIWIFIPFFYFAYLVLDAADGIQARRTKTGSPLGEFCDHFLDCFVTGEMTYSFFTVYNVTDPYLTSILLCIGYFCQISAFWERYNKGRLHFSTISSSEALILISLLITAGCIKPVHDFFVQPIGHIIPALSMLNLTLMESSMCIMGVLGTLIIISTLKRTKKMSRRFVLYLVISLILTFVATTLEKEDQTIICLTLSLFHINYAASLLISCVMKEQDPLPDILLPAAMSITLVLNIHHPFLYALYFMYIGTSVLINATRFFKKNHHYWYWVNPDLPKSEETKKI